MRRSATTRVPAFTTTWIAWASSTSSVAWLLREVEVTEEAYWRHNRELDERNANKVWSDPRAHNYYWTEFGRSAVMCPFYPWEIWHSLRHPKFDADLVVR